MLRSRYRRIIFFFARLLSSLIFWDLLLPRLGFREKARRTRPQRLRKSAARMRNMAIDMGGVMIKVGQFLSSRVDVLPQEFTSELAGLQDEVPEVKFEHIRVVAEQEFGRPLSEIYTTFEQTPVAAASLGQVHRAKLRLVQENHNLNDNPNQSGELVDVVVKIQRPNIEKIIATDLAALNTVGKWIQRYPPIRKRVNVPALLEEFSRTLYEEIDYLAEGRNAEIFGQNFEEYPGVRVPAVIWSHTTKRVLTLEDVVGIKITDYEAIDAAGIDRREVASRLLDTYLKQIFIDGFFHADPHPGNLFVSAKTGADGSSWVLTFVDFGMVGRMTQQLRGGMRELVIGVGTRDAPRVVKAYEQLGVLLPGADVALIERAEAEVFNRFWGKSMSELQQVDMAEMRAFAREFRGLLYDLPFQIPQDIIFLGRTVGILSGICTGLDADFNIWVHLEPFAQKLILEDLSNGQNWLDELSLMARRLWGLPMRFDAMLGKMERGEFVVKDTELSKRVELLESALRRMPLAVVLAAVFISGVQLWIAGQWVLATAFFAIALVLIIWLILTRRNP